MSVSRMLKIQILAHAAIEDALKAYLREAGVIEMTDASVEGFAGAAADEDAERFARLLERAETAAAYLEQYTPKPTLAERLSGGPLEVTPADIERILGEVDVERIAGRCQELEGELRRCRDEKAWAADLARELGHWTAIERPLESLATERCETQLWSFADAAAAAAADVLDRRPGAHVETVSRAGGRAYLAVIVLREESLAVAEELKQAGGTRFAMEKLRGSPAEIIEREGRRISELAAAAERAENDGRELAVVRPRLLALADHFRERRSLVEVERHFHRTERTVLIEGWIRDVHRRRFEKDVARRWRDVEIATRGPREGEDPPVALENGPQARPFEFVMTLYGRPRYGEIDPTPLLAPFFVLFFAMCLSDAGYGAVLSALCAFFLFKPRIRGGVRSLMQLLLAGGVLTIVVGVLTGGYFGVETEKLPAILRRFVIIEPLEDPMKMLNVAFFIGIVHILFGMGVKMAINFRAGLWMDAVFDDLCWILIIIALAPLGYAGILGGRVPAPVIFYASRGALAVAAVLFLTGIRKERNRFLGVFKSLLRFYGITGYFGDVLSYARLLALGLATGAIAVAINGIARMVLGLPAVAGYAAAALILLLGHAFNLLVNILGAFVHSARLQYLEFFNKFFTGGGREFRPFRSERRYTVLRETVDS
jgi:V/A-type H+-transporting ATPase subunit I